MINDLSILTRIYAVVSRPESNFRENLAQNFLFLAKLFVEICLTKLFSTNFHAKKFQNLADFV